MHLALQRSFVRRILSSYSASKYLSSHSDDSGTHFPIFISKKISPLRPNIQKSPIPHIYSSIQESKKHESVEISTVLAFCTINNLIVHPIISVMILVLSLLFVLCMFRCFLFCLLFRLDEVIVFIRVSFVTVYIVINGYKNEHSFDCNKTTGIETCSPFRKFTPSQLSLTLTIRKKVLTKTKSKCIPTQILLYFIHIASKL